MSEEQDKIKGKVSKEEIEKMHALLNMLASQNKKAQVQVNNNQEKATQKSFKEYVIVCLNAFFKVLHNSVRHVDRFVNFIVRSEDSQRDEIVQFARPPMIFGLYIIIIFIVFGGLWASFAPIDSAAIAMGYLTTVTKNKIIQHQEGGIIKTIHVTQGQFVRAGDPIITLDQTKFAGNYEFALNTYRAALALDARLAAERDYVSMLFDERTKLSNYSIQYPKFLTDNIDDKEVKKLIQTQNNILNARINIMDSYVLNTRNKISQINKSIESYSESLRSFEKSLANLNDRLSAAKKLLDQGFIDRASYMEMESRQYELQSKIVSSKNEIINKQKEISAAEADIISRESLELSNILKEFKESQVELVRAAAQFRQAEDGMKRSVIKSPVDGVVSDLAMHTIEGNLFPNDKICEIVPEDDFIIEARIDPKDIASITIGLEAKIKFNAFKQRTSPSFSGVVISLSPDVIQPKTIQQQPYYLARIKIDMHEFEKYAKLYNLKLIPGMTANVLIVKGTQSLLKYLMASLFDQVFREALTEE